MGKTIKPTLTNKEVMMEISKRTGLDFNSVFRTVATYEEIIKECISMGVCVKMGELGTWTWKLKQPSKDVVYYDFKTGENLPPKDVPGFHIPSFRPRRSWRAELRAETEFWEKEKEEIEREE